jgi:hypothetical protein
MYYANIGVARQFTARVQFVAPAQGRACGHVRFFSGHGTVACPPGLLIEYFEETSMSKFVVVVFPDEKSAYEGVRVAGAVRCPRASEGPTTHGFIGLSVSRRCVNIAQLGR